MIIHCPFCKTGYDIEHGRYECECGAKFTVDEEWILSIEESSPRTNTTSKKNTKRIILIIGGAVVAVVVLVVLFIFLGKSEKDDLSNNDGNKTKTAEKTKESQAKKYKKAILRVKKQSETIFPNDLSFSNMDELDQFITVLDNIADYTFDFQECPSEYVDAWLKYKRLSRELAGVLRKVRTKKNDIENNKNDMEALVFLESLTYGYSPSYNSLSNDINGLVKEGDRITNEMRDLDDIIKSIENKYGVKTSDK